MQIRRVVTGHTAEGKAVIASDTRQEGTTAKLFPGIEIHRLWGGDQPPSFPDDGSKPGFHSYFPAVGGFRFGSVSFPPAGEDQPGEIDMQAAQAEIEENWPGLAAYMEPDHPGMHRTATIDFAFVVSGEIWLELDDGEEVHLRAGDSVIQNGTRHAWNNRGNEACQVIYCLVGAHSAWDMP